ncbi:MAG: septum formation protein Maf [Balneolaceae bacterium]|nr:MAG: septum formation protein Maf [Balneolaceae bacterium]
MKVVLASASDRRAALLKQVGISFEIDPSAVHEEINTNRSPKSTVLKLAKEKGMDVARRHSHSLIISADTIVVIDDNILGKPENVTDARRMLQLLSGRTHQVYTGVYSAEIGINGTIEKDFSFAERTNVTFSSLDETEIDLYIQGGSPFDKAGSYGIQDDSGSLFVKKISGDYYNVVGFPLNSFYQHLKKHMPHIHQKLFLQL